MNIRMRARAILKCFPDRGNSVRRLYWKLIAIRRQMHQAIEGRIGRVEVPDPDTVYWIDPKRIEFHTNLQNVKFMRDEFHNLQNVNSVPFEDRVFDESRFRRAVLDGDWDLSPYRFTDLDIYRAFEAVVRNHARWQETEFYRTKLEWIENGRVIWECRSKTDLDQRCSYLDRLVESIRKNGYRLSPECQIEGEIKGVQHLFEEVTANIGREGQYLFQDGRHRLSIALLLGIERIPIKVQVRHKQWQMFRQDLVRMARDGSGLGNHGSLYQPCLHPDLSDIPSTHACEDRYAAIQQNLETDGGRVLDIGANLCYFCHKLEDLHLDCLAVESSMEVARIAEKLRTAEGKHFRLVSGNILDPDVQADILSARYQVVLALNIFHHFIKTRDRHEDLIRLLRRLNAHTIFFEPHLVEEEQMAGAYKNYPEAEFVAFVMNHCNMRSAKPIYRAADGRTVYKLQH